MYAWAALQRKNVKYALKKCNIVWNFNRHARIVSSLHCTVDEGVHLTFAFYNYHSVIESGNLWLNTLKLCCNAKWETLDYFSFFLSYFHTFIFQFETSFIFHDHKKKTKFINYSRNIFDRSGEKNRLKEQSKLKKKNVIHSNYVSYGIHWQMKWKENWTALLLFLLLL